MAPFSESASLSQSDKSWRLAIAAGWPVGLVVAAAIAGYKLPACGFAYLTGHSCPFCGGTRAYLALASLDPLAAWRHSASAVVAIGFGAAHTAFLLAEVFFGVRLGWSFLWVTGWPLIGFVVAANWAIRLATA
jgi:hypothetical protein